MSIKLGEEGNSLLWGRGGRVTGCGDGQRWGPFFCPSMFPMDFHRGENSSLGLVKKEVL